MRFSKFSPAPEIVSEAWKATPLRPIVSDAGDLERAAPLLDKGMVLYARAATLSGDRNMASAKALSAFFNLDVFRRYRQQLQNVFVSLQAIHGRLAIQASTASSDQKEPMQDIERDLIKNIEFLYILFACAITAKGPDRVNERLRALDFEPTNLIRSGVPWQPILKVAAAAAGILFMAMLIARRTIHSSRFTSVVPAETFDLLVLLTKIMAVNTFSVAQAMRFRSRYILLGKILFAGIGIRPDYRLYENLRDLRRLVVAVLRHRQCCRSHQPDFLTTRRIQSAGGVELHLFQPDLVAGPGLCGVAAAVSLDRPSNTYSRRSQSALIAGGAVGGGAILVGIIIARLLPSLAGDPGIVCSLADILFRHLCCLGAILGAVLPEEIRRYRAAEEKRLPDRFSVLRTPVFQYFYDIEQFQDWLNSSDSALGGRRPLDILGEESGLQKLTELVADRRPRSFPARWWGCRLDATGDYAEPGPGMTANRGETR